MKETKVELVPLKEDDRNQFILDNQRAFKYGATEEFGERDRHFEEEDEIISRKTIEESMDAENSEVYRIINDGKIVGGVVLSINKVTHRNELDLLFIAPEAHSLGIGFATWREVEKLHPETEVWETCTPYFETRNIHFYINKCGFSAVEFFNKHHKDGRIHDASDSDSENDMMFRFEKVMKA